VVPDQRGGSRAPTRYRPFLLDAKEYAGHARAEWFRAAGQSVKTGRRLPHCETGFWHELWVLLGIRLGARVSVVYMTKSIDRAADPRCWHPWGSSPAADHSVTNSRHRQDGRDRRRARASPDLQGELIRTRNSPTREAEAIKTRVRAGGAGQTNGPQAVFERKTIAVLRSVRYARRTAGGRLRRIDGRRQRENLEPGDRRV